MKMMKFLWEWWQRICKLHRSDDETAGGEFANFFMPEMTRGFFIRLGVVAVLAVAVFRFLLIPCVISGASMEPTYKRVGFTFCWRGKYWFSKPQVGDVVIIRSSGKIYYLKRIVAMPGDVVAFRRGLLYVNGKQAREPYVHFGSDWNLRPRKVKEGHYYVVGDNRSMPLEQHRFGQVAAKRVKGVPLW